MKKTNKKSGISLIVLVITIIVIIILAVAVIITLSNNNPIENAKKAVSENDEATLKEEATLLYADWYTKKNLEEEDLGDAYTYVKENLTGDYAPDLLSRLTVSDTGVITISKPLEVVEGVTIPRGFEHVEGTTVATGLVIKNTTDNNEFVWVPVEEGTFVRENFGNVNWNSTNYIEPYEEEGYTLERVEYNSMVASVSKYGGFYIGRYESSKNATTNKAQSIANVMPWNDISCRVSTTEVTGGVVEVARDVYPASSANQGDAVSTLPYGVQWDATVRFLETNYSEISQDSAEYGNYDILDENYDYVSRTTLINTGSNPDYALNNIYDIAGNLAELSMEVFTSTNIRIARGGDYALYSGSRPPVSSRWTNNNEIYNIYVGFRLALYIK